MAQVPGLPLGRDPGAARRPARARLVLADRDRAGRVRDAPDARLPDRGGDLLRHVRHRARRASTTSTCARTSRARCAAPTRSTTAMLDAAGDDPRFNVRGVRVPGRVRHRADGVGRRRVRRPARRPTTASTIVDDVKAGREVLPDKQLAQRAIGRATTGRRPDREAPLKDIDEPGLNTLDGLRAGAAATRCSRKALKMEPERRARRAARRPACAAAAAPASRWARRRPSCPRATMDKYLVCNADESEPGTFKDRECCARR